MVDAHTHLHDARYDDDRAAVIARARAVDVTALVTIGTSVARSNDAIACAEQYAAEHVYATVGLHPHIFSDTPYGDESDPRIGLAVPYAQRMAQLPHVIAELAASARAAKGRVVGVGETGLDYYRQDGCSPTEESKKWQAEGFRAQIALARALGVPIVVHGRPSARDVMDAYEDIAEIVAQNPDVPCVMHCYMGDSRITTELVQLQHVWFSFAGNVTYAKRETDSLCTVVRMIPSARLMVETDGPYLAPVPHRGERNEPAYVIDTLAWIARARDEDYKVCAARSDAVARSFFALP